MSYHVSFEIGPSVDLYILLTPLQKMLQNTKNTKILVKSKFHLKELKSRKSEKIYFFKLPTLLGFEPT
jgi:hypothetical protein